MRTTAAILGVIGGCGGLIVAALAFANVSFVLYEHDSATTARTLAAIATVLSLVAVVGARTARTRPIRGAILMLAPAVIGLIVLQGYVVPAAVLLVASGMAFLGRRSTGEAQKRA